MCTQVNLKFEKSGIFQASSLQLIRHLPKTRVALLTLAAIVNTGCETTSSPNAPHPIVGSSQQAVRNQLVPKD